MVDERMVGEGDPAPDFTLPTADGNEVTLSELKGQPVVLYFYPKDDTPGCTKEACQFRDALPRLRDEDAVVLGVSPDSPESHRGFAEKYDLNFPLLADEDHRVAEAYGVWKEKQMFGNTFWGVERSTFLLDAEGRVRKAWRRVRPDGHPEAVARELAGG